MKLSIQLHRNSGVSEVNSRAHGHITRATLTGNYCAQVTISQSQVYFLHLLDEKRIGFELEQFIDVFMARTKSLWNVTLIAYFAGSDRI